MEWINNVLVIKSNVLVLIRYADLYAASCCNLLHYPLFYLYRAPPMLMPHESTVAHEETSDKISSNTFATRMRQDTIDDGMRKCLINVILATMLNFCISVVGIGDSRRASGSSNSPFHLVPSESRSRPSTPAHPVCVHEDDDDEEETQSDETPPQLGLGDSTDENAGGDVSGEDVNGADPGVVRAQNDKQKREKHNMVMRLTSEANLD